MKWIVASTLNNTHLPEKMTLSKTNCCAIKLADYYLWDSWSCIKEGNFHLFTLATEKYTDDRAYIPPEDRNRYPFHFRHFKSTDRGDNWLDLGVFLKPRDVGGYFDSRNVWSGCIFKTDDGRWWCGYTAIAERGEDCPFMQSMAIAPVTDSFEIQTRPDLPLSCPERDRHEILRAGYYLGEVNRLGDLNGEEGGPILAWRDPFLFYDSSGQWMMVWAAKSSSRQGAIGLAALSYDGQNFTLSKLYPPIDLPDNDFTQVELPKIYFNQETGWYYLMIASCNRIDENQPNSEVERRVRLYQSKTLQDGWQPGFPQNGIIPNTDTMYGVTVLDDQFKQQSLLGIGPLDERADQDAFGVSAPFWIDV